MTIFNWGHDWHLSLSPVVADDDYSQQVLLWLNGRLGGRYVNVQLPWRRRLP